MRRTRSTTPGIAGRRAGRGLKRAGPDDATSGPVLRMPAYQDESRSAKAALANPGRDPREVRSTMAIEVEHRTASGRQGIGPAPDPEPGSFQVVRPARLRSYAGHAIACGAFAGRPSELVCGQRYLAAAVDGRFASARLIALEAGYLLGRPVSARTAQRALATLRRWGLWIAQGGERCGETWRRVVRSRLVPFQPFPPNRCLPRVQAAWLSHVVPRAERAPKASERCPDGRYDMALPGDAGPGPEGVEPGTQEQEVAPERASPEPPGAGSLEDDAQRALNQRHARELMARLKRRAG